MSGAPATITMHYGHQTPPYQDLGNGCRAPWRSNLIMSVNLLRRILWREKRNHIVVQSRPNYWNFRENAGDILYCQHTDAHGKRDLLNGPPSPHLGRLATNKTRINSKNHLCYALEAGNKDSKLQKRTIKGGDHTPTR
jgi:hypothetical protein